MTPPLDFSATGEPSVPRLAATVVLVRDGEQGLEVFCVQRSAKSSFLAGALVFPGGQLDADDAHWAETLPVHPKTETLPSGAALALAALRETIEEAGILLTRGAPLDEARLAQLRRALAEHQPLRPLLEAERHTPLLADLLPMARWITPTREPKRFDTAFFLARAPEGQSGAHDDSETVASSWARPGVVLERWARGAISMVPPTHATLAWLAERPDVDAALRDAAALTLDPLCPELLVGPPLSLVLPGDPEHSIPRGSHPYAVRYTQDGARFVPR